MILRLNKVLQRNNQRQAIRWLPRSENVTTEFNYPFEVNQPNSPVSRLNSNEASVGLHTSEELQTIIPTLAHLSHQKRWIIWIAPPFMPSASVLAKQGVDVSRVIVITPSQLSDHFTAMNSALKSGSYSAVLAWHDNTIGDQLQELATSAVIGNTIGYIFDANSVRLHH